MLFLFLPFLERSWPSLLLVMNFSVLALLGVSVFILPCMVSYINIIVRNQAEGMKEERNVTTQNLASRRLEENRPMLDLGK